jgi:hypothetical protein
VSTMVNMVGTAGSRTISITASAFELDVLVNSNLKN